MAISQNGRNKSGCSSAHTIKSHQSLFHKSKERVITQSLHGCSLIIQTAREPITWHPLHVVYASLHSSQHFFEKATIFALTAILFKWSLLVVTGLLFSAAGGAPSHQWSQKGTRKEIPTLMGETLSLEMPPSQLVYEVNFCADLRLYT